MLVAAGIGLVGTAGVSAAPINGAVIGDAANATSPVEIVQHRRWGSRGGHWRWGSRGVRRCHRPYSSRWRPCW
jgi:hypothetical protein